MLLSTDKTVLEKFSDSMELEWLETNGLGGWSGCSITGCNTRRYHGLLMAAVIPPTDRMLLVSKLDDTIILNGNSYGLSANDYGTVIAPQGYHYLESFKKDCFPEWVYAVAGVRLRKTITMVQGENTTLIRYEVLKAETPFTLQLLPLIAARGYHQLQHANNHIFWDIHFNDGIFRNQPFDGAPEIFISVPGSVFQSVNKWYYHFNYQREKYRGLDDVEDLFNHGFFSVSLKAGDTLDIVLSTENPSGRNTSVLFENEKNRRANLQKGLPDILLRQLTLAADQFIVKRVLHSEKSDLPAVELKTVIAGYHWFTDWGRDTMISLPGLCLQTGRYDDAKKIISIFAKSVSMGMLPNRFLDNNEAPEYNTVDGTLWYFNAVYAYLQFTNDRIFILKEILPVLKDIISWHFKGTRFNIHVDDDGLLYAGQPGEQLTWMDARVGSWVVTPRMGKPVEIQALWYNALKIFESILTLNGENFDAEKIQRNAEQAKKSFQLAFWNEKCNCLYDLIDQNRKPDASIRPNQIFAISLPFALMEGDQAKSIFNIICSELYTPVGLRSLSPDDPAYKGHYGGDQFERDFAYHQGTVWSWLLGAYLEAGMKTFGANFKPAAQEIINRFDYHLNEGCIGSVSEIFDGDAPHNPRGCVAQAWGVAEILRVIKTYSIFHAGN